MAQALKHPTFEAREDRGFTVIFTLGATLDGSPVGEGFIPDGLPAAAVVTGKDGFWDAVAGALDQVGCPFRCAGLFSHVGAALLGQEYASRSVP